jgi:hypothetical protein
MAEHGLAHRLIAFADLRQSNSLRILSCGLRGCIQTIARACSAHLTIFPTAILSNEYRWQILDGDFMALDQAVLIRDGGDPKEMSNLARYHRAQVMGGPAEAEARCIAYSAAPVGIRLVVGSSCRPAISVR